MLEKSKKTATCLHWSTWKHDSKVIDIFDEHEPSSVRENDEGSLFLVRLIQTDKEIIDNRIVKDKIQELVCHHRTKSALKIIKKKKKTLQI